MVPAIVIDAVTVWLSAVASALPAPAVPPAVYVAVAAPLTNWVLAPESAPKTGLLKIVAGGTGNAGKPLSSVVNADPTFLPFMSAVKVELAPVQISLGLALCLS